MEAGYKNMLKARDKGSETSTRELVLKYLSYLPLFILSLALFGGGAYLYIRHTVPKYTASTLLLVKDEKSATNLGTGTSNDLLNNAMKGVTNVNIENELRRLKSMQMMDKVVARYGFNISYYLLGKVRKSDIYKDAPFRLEARQIRDSASVELTLKDFSSGGVQVTYGPDNDTRQIPVKWGQPFSINGNEFVLNAVSALPGPETVYSAQWNPIRSTTWELLGKFNADVSDKKTSIIQLSILIENLQRGKDILDAISQEFINANAEVQNRITQNTIKFIEDRLALVANELNGVEGNLEDLQGRQQIYSLEQQSSQSISNSDETAKALNAILVQQRVVDLIQASLTGANGQTRLVPSTLGLSDPSLASLVGKYNELQMQKEREAGQVGESSVIMRDINGQLNNLRATILENLKSISRNLQLQQNSIQQQNSRYSQSMAALPRKERQLQEIKRQQSIKEGLYLYLLQKREEAAITRTSKSSNYEQIDAAHGYGPVEPNTTNIYRFAIVFGLLLPALGIYVKESMNDTIMSREDIMKKTAIPIIGEVCQVDKKNSKVLPVKESGLIAEQFRMLRSNLAFLQKGNEHKVILVTSSDSGEGKSFVTRNLAAILTKGGKKTALLEFDFRRPDTAFEGINREIGIIEYLSNQCLMQDIGQPLEDVPGLTVYPAGTPTSDMEDLLVDKNLVVFFGLLRQKYDYIIINSAPAGLVGDALVLGSLSDTVIYIVRQGQTTRKQVNFADDLFRTRKFPNLCIVFNGVRTGGKYGYYGYGYKAGSNYYNQTQPSLLARMKSKVGL